MNLDTRVHIEVALVRQRKNKAWLAKQLKISRNFLTLILLGRRRVRLDIALKLHELTGVPLQGLVSPIKKRKRHSNKGVKRGRPARALQPPTPVVPAT